MNNSYLIDKYTPTVKWDTRVFPSGKRGLRPVEARPDIEVKQAAFDAEAANILRVYHAANTGIS